MALTSADTLRSEFRLPPSSELADTVVDAAIARASRYLKKVIDGAGAGSGYYFDAQADYDDDPADLDDATLDIQTGEKYYAVSELLNIAGIRWRRDGFVKRQQDAGSPAIASGSQIVNEYFSIKEVQELAKWYREQAIGYIDDYTISGPVTMGTIQLAS